MPAELFPVVLVGGGLLVWAAIRAGLRRGIIGWGLAAAVGFLIVSMALAMVTGLASGETGRAAGNGRSYSFCWPASGWRYWE